MKVAFDTETWPIQFVENGHGTRMLAPKMVCGSFASYANAFLHDRDKTLKELEYLLDHKELIIGHNIAYDLGVVCAESGRLLPKVFAALAAGLISDTGIRQKLINIALGMFKAGSKDFVSATARFPLSGCSLNQLPHLASEEHLPAKYGLADLVKLYFNEHLEKEDTWRLRYNELDGMPLTEWPQEARDYAINDAESTLRVYEAQEEFTAGKLANEAEQVQAAFALHLISLWGLRADAEKVCSLKATLLAEQEQARALLLESGIMKPNGVKDTKKIRLLVQQAFQEQGLQVPKTEKTGQPKISEDVLQQTKHPALVALADSGSSAKLLSTYIGTLEARTHHPVGCSYGLVGTGRSSSFSPNDQNPPRKGGVRECYVPRSGNVFVGADYDTLELRSWAQVCLELLGESRMAAALRAGEDLHLSLAARCLDRPVSEIAAAYKAGDETVSDWRQIAKVANFGFPGGMAAKTFVLFAADQKLVISMERAERLHVAWKTQWPEHKPYFAFIQKLIDPITDEIRIEQVYSKRLRGGLRFTEAANSFFQGLAADGAKEALFRVQHECYTERESPLFGCRPVLFMHDEIIMEAPESRAASAAARLAEVMIAGMAKFIRDVPVTVKPVLMRCWYKGAKPIYIDGELVPCKPVYEDVDGKRTTNWIADT